MKTRIGCAVLLLAAASCGGGGGGAVPIGVASPITFSDVTLAAGLVHTAQHAFGAVYIYQGLAGGACAGDFDGDGWDDLYVVGGDLGPNLLYRNRGDGTFEEIAAAAGVDLPGARRSGPSCADYDGDGDLDLFVGGLDFAAPVLFRNRGDGTFEDATAEAGLVFTRRHTIGAAWGDVDGDADLDLFVAHYGIRFSPERAVELLWRNEGDGTFTDVSESAGITATYDVVEEWIFTPNFADVNGDGAPDLLLVGDFETTQLFLNDGAGGFVNAGAPLDDENGMGSAIGDYDNDGDLDWFVSSIFDADGVAEGKWGVTGNRLYRNRGDGSFEDATDEAGVRHGFWGWGSAFADFDNDGWLDLLHVNGVSGVSPEPDFEFDPSRLFLANGDGTFREAAAAAGFDDDGQGRGVVCFDYDGDGDLDVLVANAGEAPRLWRNDGGNAHGFLEVRLEGTGANRFGLGARVFVTVDGETQMREVARSNHYVSQGPAAAWFGLGGAAVADVVRVEWPGGAVTERFDVPANGRIVLRHP